MTFEQFCNFLKDSAPPAALPPLLVALWWDANGDWNRAHELAQSAGERKNSHDAAWVHAYLHRKEGDTQNAAYWYRRAGHPLPTSTLEEEWSKIAIALLDRARSVGHESELS